MAIMSGTDFVVNSMLEYIKYSKKDKTVSIRMAEPDYQRLQELAKKYNVSLSIFLRCWIYSVLDFEENLELLENHDK